MTDRHTGLITEIGAGRNHFVAVCLVTQNTKHSNTTAAGRPHASRWGSELAVLHIRPRKPRNNIPGPWGSSIGTLLTTCVSVRPVLKIRTSLNTVSKKVK